MTERTDYKLVILDGLKGSANSAPFNLATEEYLLENCSENYVYLWRNRSAVIIGKNQNTLAEVDLEYTNSHGIEVIRRMSGGGAVYHDMGNICYTVIAPYDSKIDSYKEFTKPVIEYLASIGIEAEFSGRNDITAGGYKISGNAQRIKGNRILHHGTILFDTDLTVLEKALIPSPLKLKSKGIKSVRARVKNVRDMCKQDMTADEFFNALQSHFAGIYPIKRITEEEIEKIEEIASQKYATYEWNVGYSPKSEYKKECRFPYGTVEISFDLIDGTIQNPVIHGDFFELESIGNICKNLVGVYPLRESLIDSVKDIHNYIKGATAEEFIDKLFFSGE